MSDSLPDIIVKARPKTCRICRNPAVGHHYDVASCNGCKSFFRRTIITGRRYTCKLDGRCFEGHDPIDPQKETRLCGACRFSKCVEAGMNPSSIKATIISEKGQTLLREIQKVDDVANAIKSLTETECQLQKLHNLPGNLEDSRTFRSILESTPIFDAFKIPNLVTMEPSSPCSSCNRMAHNSFLSVIESMKLMPFFRRVSIDSQRKLIVNSVLTCCNMVTSYHSITRFKSDVVRCQNGMIAGIPMRSYNGIWVDHQKILQTTLHSFLRLRVNAIEFMFLKAIVICNPDLPRIPETDQMLIEQCRTQYAQQFLKHCLKEHGTAHGANRFADVLSIISALERQKDEQKSFGVVFKYYCQNLPIIISPLCDEIMEEFCFQ